MANPSGRSACVMEQLKRSAGRADFLEDSPIGQAALRMTRCGRLRFMGSYTEPGLGEVVIVVEENRL